MKQKDTKLITPRPQSKQTKERHYLLTVYMYAAKREVASVVVAENNKTLIEDSA